MIVLAALIENPPFSVGEVPTSAVDPVVRANPVAARSVPKALDAVKAPSKVIGPALTEPTVTSVLRIWMSWVSDQRQTGRGASAEADRPATAVIGAKMPG